MDKSEENLKEQIRNLLLARGASAVGFAKAGENDTDELDRQDEWLKRDFHAGMSYMKRHLELKSNTEKVLTGSKTVISIAFSYAPPSGWRSGQPMIAAYAAGDDYHDVLRLKLQETVSELEEKCGGEWRICIDSAPLTERHIALKAGIGKRGLNGFVIVDRCGTWCFLAEILTTLTLSPDEPSTDSCIRCKKCIKACPTGALQGEGMVDSRKCLNYLTIEHRGEWTAEMKEIMSSATGKNTLFGCDVCQKVCPHNEDVLPTSIDSFKPREEISRITAQEIAALTDTEFSRIFKGSPIKRAKAEGMRRNANNVLNIKK